MPKMKHYLPLIAAGIAGGCLQGVAWMMMTDHYVQASSCFIAFAALIRLAITEYPKRQV